MPLMERPPLTSQRPKRDMHTIFEFRAERSKLTQSPKALDKSNNNVDSGVVVNGSGKSSKTSNDNGQSVTSSTNGNVDHKSPGISPKKGLYSSLDGPQVAQKSVEITSNGVNGATSLNGGLQKFVPLCVDNGQSITTTNGFCKPTVINGNRQAPGVSSKKGLHSTLEGAASARQKNAIKDIRLDQVTTNNRRNSWKESRFEANIVLAQCIEKIHMNLQNQQSPQPRSNGTVLQVDSSEPSGYSEKNSVSGIGHMNGHRVQNLQPAVSLAGLCQRNSYIDANHDSLLKPRRNGLSSSQQWSGGSSLRSDISGQGTSSDSEDDDFCFFLQENGSSEDNLDDDSSSVASFAGRRNYLMPEKVICGVTGTVRGMRNRVRAGIATFVQPANATKNFSQLESSKVVVYTTSNGIVRETFQKCLKVKTILSTFLVPFEERDIFKSRAFQREMVDRLPIDQMAVPQVFVEGHHLGDADIIEDLNEQGKLRKILRPYKRPGALIPCQKCGGYRLLLCNACNGSKKSVRRNRFTESLGPLRCGKCDECGLIQCDLCCTVQTEDNTIGT